MMNEDTLKGKWLEMKGEILTHWGKMTDDELDKTEGNAASILGLIQQKYGAKKEEVQEKFHEILARFNDKAESVKTDMRNDQKNDETLH